MLKTKQERVAIFLARVQELPAPSSFEEARTQLAHVLNEVEDQYSGVVYNADTWLSDGRMYPPKDDSIRTVNGHPEIKRFRSRGHNTYIGENGAVRIRLVGTNEVILDRPGHDGRRIPDDSI